MAENNVLTNSAAEYIDHHQVDSALGLESPGTVLAQFVPPLDEFRPRDSISREVYHQEAKKKAKVFEDTLARFCKLVEDKKLDKALGITLKRPQQYRMEDVLQIANKLHEIHKNAAEIKSCSGVFRKCFRFAGDNDLTRLLKFVPSDTYGSIICGGLTTTVRAGKIRKEIYAALESIPVKLELARGLSSEHFKSHTLLRLLDSVFVSLFVVLERIVSELSETLGKKSLKAILKGDSYGADIQQALADFDADLRTFKEHAQLCDSQRLGRIEEHLLCENEGMEKLRRQLKDTQEALQKQQLSRGDLESKPWKTIEDEKEISHLRSKEQSDSARLGVLNNFYKLFTSSESFDPRTGKAASKTQLLSVPSAQAFGQAFGIALSRSITPEPRSPGANKRLIRKWVKNAPLEFTKLSRGDMQESLRQNLNSKEEAKVQWIITSEKLLEWLRTTKSHILIIQGQTAPMELSNSLSFSSAFVAHSLQASYKCPVLYHSCLMRTYDDSPSADERSGPLALINSLNSQLLEGLKKRQDMDFSFLKKQKYGHSKTQKSLRSGIRLLRRLVDEIPEDDAVLVVIDSISRMTGRNDEADEAVHELLNIVSQARATIKVLLTDLLPSAAQRFGEQSTELFVPDDVDGENHGINTRFLRDLWQEPIEQFETDWHSPNPGSESDEGSSSQSTTSPSMGDTKGRRKVRKPC